MPAISFCVSFFFSSRTRHTRCSRDWSSDVCSSDLGLAHGGRGPTPRAGERQEPPPPAASPRDPAGQPRPPRTAQEIGRASCRERVYISEFCVRIHRNKYNVELLTVHNVCLLYDVTT